MSVRRLDHVSITTGDLDRSIAFYRDVVDLPFRDRGVSQGADIATIVGMPGARVAWAEFDLGAGQILEVLQYLEPAGEPLRQRTSDPGSAHVAFEVDDISATYDRLVTAGVTTRSAPVTIEDDDESWRGVLVVYALDPDGFTVEFLQRPDRRSTEPGG
jgi:catechol 2,3-dioxygenase-like lactoylglutathione lyase family enzyme